MTDVKIAQLEERQQFQQRELDSIKPTMQSLASSMQRMADDMHKIATFDVRVTALEKARDKSDAFEQKIQTQIAKLFTADAVAGVKLSATERFFWVGVSAMTALVTAAVIRNMH